ncbi:hypothetical protein LXA43DRAFT_168292 [Ganoderma leucocontextum]|nr:hypothetical protein LXA43DRAFT_168292 [Ganoderma leucocontextum]
MLLPLSKPIRMLYGSALLSLPIPRGTRLIPNMAACNVDPVLSGPDASKWKSERWLKRLPKAREEARVRIFSYDDVSQREQSVHRVQIRPNRAKGRPARSPPAIQVRPHGRGDGVE